jgi:alkylation response protein AidB-like acyl-CoA dehydrogenase
MTTTVAELNALPDDDFRMQLREFFESAYPDELRHQLRRFRWSEIRDWTQTLHQKGWIAPNWPLEYGGMGLDASKLVIFMEEQERAGVGRAPDMGVVNVGPLLIKFGSTEQKQFYLPKILSFEHIWCQGYSEPNTGSDLASVQTRAVLEGDEFVVNGQKIWTTLAQDATHMFALVRTDPNVKKQAGISFLLIDLRVAGVTICPIRNLAGHEEFCQVFLDDVRVPRGNLVGEINQGWTLAKALLGFERIFTGSPKRCQYVLGRLELTARQRGLFNDQGFVDRFAQVSADVADLSAAYRRYVEVIKQGGTLGTEVSMLKIWATETLQRIADLMFESSGEYSSIPGDHDMGGEKVDLVSPFFTARWVTIGAGSSEIQRNLIARNVLALPSH